MYAVVETGGKQIMVKEGQDIYVEKLDAEVGEKVILENVVLVSDGTTKIGTPYVKGAKINCTVAKQGKDKKITIFKYTAKKGSTRRKQGHRQPYTKLTIDSIVG